MMYKYIIRAALPSAFFRGSGKSPGYFFFSSRTIMLELTILGVLVGFWYMQATDPMNFTTTSPATDFTTDSSLFNGDDNFTNNKTPVMQSLSAVSMVSK